MSDGARFGRYTLIKRIGDGGAAEVFIAEPKSRSALEQLVAIKRFRKREALRELSHEARLSAVLRHPFIARVYAADVIEGVPFLVMEYVAGKNLSQLLAALPGRVLRWPLLVALGAAVAEALACAHDRSEPVFHCDLKPSNVLVSFNGAPKLVDFGAGAGFEELKSDQGLALGTAAYVAPERLDGARASATFDVYGLCLTLHEALSGAPAFVRADTRATLHAVLNERPPSLQSRRDVPKALAAAIDGGLAKRPEQRPTLAELRGALQRSARDVEEVSGLAELGALMRSAFPDEARAADRRAGPNEDANTLPATERLDD